MDIHEHGFLLLALMFIQNIARNPVLVNNRLSAASYLSQTLASNLAKSQEAQFSGWWEGDLDLHGPVRRQIFVESLGGQAEVVECPGLVLNRQFHGLSGLATEERRLEVIVVGLQVYRR